jgi:2-methylcitrate dehydratase PrpD
VQIEKRLAEYVLKTDYDHIPKEPIDIIKNVILTVIGTSIAGATAEGCEILVSQVKEWGGREEANILIHGGKVPAHNAAFVNSTMARALDFCDAMIPGIHIGSSSVPTALAAAELGGGCSGKEFLSALVLATEVAARINSVSIYDGFDPTGVCAIFATTAVAGRLLHLSLQQMVDALALGFNKAGGSFQSNVDASLAVRVIQGFVSQGGIICAQLAKREITGPKNFLEGVYGYFHLYGKDKSNPQTVTNDLGEKFELNNTLFKKYPSCGGTLGSTDAILDLIEKKNLNPEDVLRVDVKVSPYIYKLVGHQFEIGKAPKVNAQFSIQYCVANALLRKSSKLSHFDDTYVKESKILELVRKIHVFAEPTLDDPQRPGFSLKTRMKVTTKRGDVYDNAVDIPRGVPGNPLTQNEHIERFLDCLEYSAKKSIRVNGERIISMVYKLEEVEDVRSLIPLILDGKGNSF